MGSECSTSKCSSTGKDPTKYTLQFSFNPTSIYHPKNKPPEPRPKPQVPIDSHKSWVADNEAHKEEAKEQFQALSEEDKRALSRTGYLDTKAIPSKRQATKFSTQRPAEPKPVDDFATFSPEQSDENTEGKAPDLTVAYTEEEPEQMPTPNVPKDAVDYSDIAEARAAFKQRLKTDGKAQPIPNGEELEAMYRNHRMKTHVPKGGVGRVEYEPQQTVANLLPKFNQATK